MALTASRPEIQIRASSLALLGLVALLARERLVFAVGLAPVAVMGLVVDDDDVPLAAQFAADAVHHLVGRLGERTRLTVGQNLLGQLAGVDRLAQLEGVVVGDDDLGLAELIMELRRNEVALAVVVLGSFGSSTRSRSRMVMPGVTMRNVSEKRASCGLASLLSVCQAMSMAMTTVLPEPVAILKAMRGRPGFDVSLASRIAFSIQASPYFSATSVMIDSGFEGLDLAEEELLLAVRVGPVGKSCAVVGVTPT